MADVSSWLQYLPPVLWRDDPAPPDFSMGGTLRIFEKLLTGITDPNDILHDDHEHESVKAVIDRLPRLFDPWTTPPEFLDWLATWVALELPDIWDDYQQRKVTAEIVDIYRRRGVKEGLDQYLDLYTVADTRPRIAVDDCSKVLWVDPVAGTFAPINTLISQLPLVSPISLAVAPDGSLFVGDSGVLNVNDEKIYRLPPPGQYEFEGAPPQATALEPPAFNLVFPMAMVTVGTSPYDLYVLDRVTLPLTLPALRRLTSPGFATATTIATKAQLGTVWPVGMVVDTNGHLLILDRGAGTGVAAAPKVIDVQLSPLVITSTNLAQVLEPLSLAVHPSGDLIIGDGREQNASVPGDLVRVDRTAGPWVETRLLSPLADWDENPIVSPVAISLADPDIVYVADQGLKPHMPDLASPFIKKVAEPGTVYRVDIAALPPVVTRASAAKQLVQPTAMVAVGESLYLTDRGEFSDPVFAGAVERFWRGTTGEFGVVLYFSEQRPTTQLQRRRIVRDVLDIVDQQAPGHTGRAFVFAV